MNNRNRNSRNVSESNVTPNGDGHNTEIPEMETNPPQEKTLTEFEQFKRDFETQKEKLVDMLKICAGNKNMSGLSASLQNALVSLTQEYYAKAAEIEVASLCKELGIEIKVKGQAKVKYRDPNNSANTWSGRGKRPTWLNEAIGKGAKLEDFEVKETE